MKKLLLLIVFVLTGCNDPLDVIIVGDFKHAIEFHERGLRVNALNQTKVLAEFDKAGFPITGAQLAQRQADTINGMPGGTVILNFGGGYQAVYDTLTKYPGRKIYCAGIQYWNVELPEGCIQIGNIYDKLSAMAPISLAQWRAANAPKTQTVIVNKVKFLPRNTFSYHLYVLNPEKIEQAKVLAANIPWYVVIDATDSRGIDFDEFKTSIGCRTEKYFDCDTNNGLAPTDDLIIARPEYNGSGDDTMWRAAAYYFTDPIPSCNLGLWMGGGLHRGQAETIAINPGLQQFIDDELCWTGPSEAGGDFGPHFDLDAALDLLNP